VELALVGQFPGLVRGHVRIYADTVLRFSVSAGTNVGARGRILEK